MFLEIVLKIFSCIPYLLKFDWSSIIGIFNNQGYCFREYKKHITVYRNGNGIVINSFKLKVLNPSKVDSIYRRMNIDDGKLSSNFPKLNDMKSTNIDNRFEDFGFWFISDEEIVTKAKEYYWSEEDVLKKDYTSESNTKEIRWKFLINENKIKKGKEYTVTYVMSIPGMFPLENGYYVKSLHDSKYNDYNFSSSMKVDHAIKKLTYVVAFENGINLDEMPRCVICNPKKNSTITKKPIHGNEENNYIFKKYTYNIKKPHFQSRIKIKWNIEEKRKNP